MVEHVLKVFNSPNVNKKLNNVAVSTYRITGLALLFAIVVGMFFYLATTLFYTLSRSWVVPSILTARNEKVMQASFNFLERRHELQKLEAERIGLQNEIAFIQAAAGLHEEFLKNFEQAERLQAESDKRYLGELDGIVGKLKSSAPKAAENSQAFLSATRDRLSSQYESRLIDDGQLVSGEYLLSQIDMNALSHKEKLAQLKRERDAVKARVASGSGRASLEVLMRDRHRMDSMISRRELVSRLAPLEARLGSLDETIAQFRKNVDLIAASPYVRAAKEDLSIAFAPYENLGNVRAGAPVYGCHLEFVACRRVGQVESVLDGEVSMRHPFNGRDMRGQMVRVTLNDIGWAENRSLVVNRRPLLF